MSDQAAKLRQIETAMRREAALWPKNERAQQTARLLNSFADDLAALSVPRTPAPSDARLDEVGEAIDGLQSYETQEIESMRGLEGHEDWLKLDDVRAMMARLRAALPPSSSWHPIATAPKDGTWILGWDAVMGMGVYQMPLEGDECPTHWMPMPEPPASSVTPEA